MTYSKSNSIIANIFSFDTQISYFQGDFLGHDVTLPKVEKGDIIVVHDTGGYTMSMYSKYNSITPSTVYGYERRGEGGGFRIRCFKVLLNWLWKF